MGSLFSCWVCSFFFFGWVIRVGVTRSLFFIRINVFIFIGVTLRRYICLFVFLRVFDF